MPRPEDYPVTAADVAAAPAIGRARLIEQMAASTWTAWTAHHDAVRSWLDDGRPGAA